MLNLRIINDIHIFGPLESHSLSQLIEIIRMSKVPVYLLGDLIDYKNCRKQDVGKAKDAIHELNLMTNYILGNHELVYLNKPNFLLIENDQVFLTHGHLYTNFKKYSKWNSQFKEPGAGFLKRHIVSPIIDSMRRFLAVRPNDELKGHIQRLKSAYPNLRYFVMGHSHILKTTVFNVAGVKLVMLQRGVNDLELEL